MTSLQHVNASGFPLQLAIARAVRDSLPDWRILYEEHAWRSTEGNGFIDIAIEWEPRTWVMNIECKRVRESEWIFLRDTTAPLVRRHAKLWITYALEVGEFTRFNWTEMMMDPQCIESNMCVVAGQDPKSTPMLERVASSLIQSTEALAAEEARLLSKTYIGLRMYQNVIVTTAKLIVCDVSPDTINLSNGELDATSKFAEVPYVRFRKQIGASTSSSQISLDVSELGKFAKQQESTVFVVNADHFVDFVERCCVDTDSVQRVCGLR